MDLKFYLLFIKLKVKIKRNKKDGVLEGLGGKNYFRDTLQGFDEK